MLKSNKSDKICLVTALLIMFITISLIVYNWKDNKTNIKKLAVGECYVRESCFPFVYCDRKGKLQYEEGCTYNWKEFSEIIDEVNGYVKTDAGWCAKEDLFYYTDVYKPLKEKIEQRHRD